MGPHGVVQISLRFNGLFLSLSPPVSLEMSSNARIAYWMSDKKSQKINWGEFEAACAKYGFELFKLNLSKSIQSQGPFVVFLHKLTDIIASANQGDSNCSRMIAEVERYISTHERLIVVDPIDKVRQLLDRYKCYSKIHSTDLHQHGVFTPNFCEIASSNINDVSGQLGRSSITYPFICKPQLGHGSKKAHEMLIVFSESGLKDCRAPCVAQSFVNHNAVLFKIFIVGERYYYVQRPSLKNFYAGDCESIFFDSSVVSKAGAQSNLTILEPHEEVGRIVPDERVFEKITSTLRKAFGMDLLGIDVVIENNTGRYGIIDVNAYPGYDGFPNFYDALLQCIYKKVSNLTEGTNDKNCDSYRIPESINNDDHSIINGLQFLLKK